MDDLLIEPTPQPGKPGRVKAVSAGSFAEAVGLQAGDLIYSVNGEPVEDIIDVQFYAAEPYVEFDIERDSEEYLAVGERESGQLLGIEFEHPTFDIDIRRCNNLCPFCFVLQTAPRMRRTLYIKDDDYRYSFLFGHYVTLTNLSEHDWWRIEHQGLSPLYVSVHATDLAVRRQCLKNATAPDIMEQLRWLAARGVVCHTQLVITPGLNDGAALAQSVRELAGLYPAVRSISVVPVGLTQHHKYGLRAQSVDEANAVLDAVHSWQAEFRAALGVNLVYATDEWYLVTGRAVPVYEQIDGLELHENGLGQVRNFLDHWGKEQGELRALNGAWAGRQATLVTGTLFSETLTGSVAEFNALAGTALRVQAVTNTRLGAGITVAGLLMGQDVIDQLQGQALGEFVALPRVMFDHPQGVALDDISPAQIAQALAVPVVLVDLLGDVIDGLAGTSKLLFDPARGLLPVDDLMRRGGWAVEKYL